MICDTTRLDTLTSGPAKSDINDILTRLSYFRTADPNKQSHGS